MLYCNDCATFNEGHTYKNLDPESVNPPELVCNNCGSGDLEPADKCPMCGEWKQSCNDFCDRCDSMIADATSEAIQLMEDRLGVDFEMAKTILNQYLDFN